jgi:FkbM family methyltransferase
MSSIIKRVFHLAGLDIRRARHPSNVGWDAMADIAGHLARSGHADRPVLFDVGANAGQTVAKFRTSFKSPVIHSFEPGSSAFATLQKHTAGTPDLTLNNFALGAQVEERTLLEMPDERADMNSFLEPGSGADVQVQRRSVVRVRTIDDYCVEKGIERIDVLKSDTQGFDLEVLRGADQMIRRGAVRFVYVELNFCELYKSIPPVDVVLKHLRERDFELVSFYTMYHQNFRAGWTDGLFIHSGS